MDIFSILISSPMVWAAIVVIYTLKKGIYFVPQNRGYVIYTLGKYDKTLKAGLNFIIPFIQTVAADRNLKEQSLDILSQSAITKDNITLGIDGILFMKVVDAAAATNNVNDYKTAVTQLAMTTMRNSIGSLELDDCFQNRDTINAKILHDMTEATQPWGVMVTCSALAASASNTRACFKPSASVIAALLTPSAVSITERFSRSAVICFSMSSRID